MANQDPQAVAERWARQMGQASKKIEEGVMAVDQSPTELAAQAADRYAAGVADAVASGRFQRGLRRVSLSDWQEIFKKKGLARIASGATAAIGKMAQFMTQFLPYVQQGAAKVRKMPKGTLADSIARATAMIEHNAAFKRS